MATCGIFFNLTREPVMTETNAVLVDREGPVTIISIKPSALP